MAGKAAAKSLADGLGITGTQHWKGHRVPTSGHRSNPFQNSWQIDCHLFLESWPWGSAYLEASSLPLQKSVDFWGARSGPQVEANVISLGFCLHSPVGAKSLHGTRFSLHGPMWTKAQVPVVYRCLGLQRILAVPLVPILLPYPRTDFRKMQEH